MLTLWRPDTCAAPNQGTLLGMLVLSARREDYAAVEACWRAAHNPIEPSSVVTSGSVRRPAHTRRVMRYPT